MLPSDVLAVLQWWIVLLILGVGFLPVTVNIFKNFFDKGYIFSKVLGLCITSYAIFLFGVLHIFPFTIISSYFIFIITAGIFFWFIFDKKKTLAIIKQSWRIILFEEILFLIALFFWAYIHTFAPDIHGLEKYMDFGFINSTLRADYFPPKDMWFTPLYINYYYFGHFMTAVLTRLSNLPSAITFNLMLSTIFALCFTETFSLGANLYTFLNHNQKIIARKRILTGFLTTMLVTFAGNLHIIYGFFKPYSADNPLPFWQLEFLPRTFPNSYWYPNATRYIYHTIHEFPIYSWVVADLHGHVLDIPFVLLTIGLLLALFMRHDPEQKKEEKIEKKSNFLDSFLINPLVLILTGFILSIMYMTNAWDGAIYLIFAALIICNIHWQQIPEYQQVFQKDELSKINKHTGTVKKSSSYWREKWFHIWGRDILLSMLFVLSSFILFNIPYSIFFKPFVSGIGVLCATDLLGSLGSASPVIQNIVTHGGKIGPFLLEPNHCQHSFWWELLTLYGFFYFFVVSFIIFVLRSKKIYHIDSFILIVILLSTMLILIPEFIYVKDIYPAHFRANTMFKLVFQSFIMLSICSAYIFIRLLHNPDNEKQGIYRFKIFPILSLMLIALVMSYPYIAINSYYNNLKVGQGLDGMAYLGKSYATDYSAIQWLNKNVKGQPVILEAQGDSYTDFARVSANTGLPTVLGWTVHEWLWRGSYDVPAPRINEVKVMYETKDAKEAKKLLDKYNVTYVFIGIMEFQKYPLLDENKFSQIGRLVFQDGTTKIYQIGK